MENKVRGMRVRVFTATPPDLETAINAWLADNAEVVIRDIRVIPLEQSEPPYLVCMLFYGGKEDPEARKAGFRGGL